MLPLVVASTCFCESSIQLIASVVIAGFALWNLFRILFRLLFEVSQMNAPSSSHTAEGCWVHFPVFNRIGKQAYYGVSGLLHAGVDGAKIIDFHFADFVAMEENHLNKEMCQFLLFIVSSFAPKRTRLGNLLQVQVKKE